MLLISLMPCFHYAVRYSIVCFVTGHPYACVSTSYHYLYNVVINIIFLLEEESHIGCLHVMCFSNSNALFQMYVQKACASRERKQHFIVVDYFGPFDSVKRNKCITNCTTQWTSAITVEHISLYSRVYIFENTLTQLMYTT